MKRLLKIVALVVVLLVVGVAGLLAYTFMGRSPVADGRDIGRVHIVADGFSSVAIVRIDDQRVALVDAGEDEAGEAILAELGRRNLGADAVSAIDESRPLDLRLATDGGHRNWEGLAELPERGFLVITDSAPGTQLGYVPGV